MKTAQHPDPSAIRYRKVLTGEEVALPCRGNGFIRRAVDAPSLYFEGEDVAFLIPIADLKKACAL